MILAMDDDKLDRMACCEVTLKELPRDMNYCLHCLVHSALLTSEQWPPLSAYGYASKGIEPPVYCFLSAPAIPFMANAQKPFLPERDRVLRLTPEIALNKMLNDTLEILGTGNEISMAGGEEQRNDDVYEHHIDPSATSTSINHYLVLKQMEQRKELQKADIKSLFQMSRLYLDRSGSIMSCVLGKSKSRNELEAETESGQDANGFLTTFHTDPMHPDKPILASTDTRLEMGVGLEFGPSLSQVSDVKSTGMQTKKYLVTRLVWQVRYNGGLPVDEFEVYRRIEIPCSSKTGVESHIKRPWERVFFSLDNTYLDALPVSLLSEILLEHIQPSNISTEISTEGCIDEELELGEKVIEIPRPRDKLQGKGKLGSLKILYKVRAHNRSGWGGFSTPTTVKVRPQSEQEGLTSLKLVEEVRSRLQMLSRGGPRAGLSRDTERSEILQNLDSESDLNDFIEMLSPAPSRPITAYEINDGVDVIDGDNVEKGQEENTDVNKDERDMNTRLEEEKEGDEEFDFEAMLEKLHLISPLAN